MIRILFLFLLTFNFLFLGAIDSTFVDTTITDTILAINNAQFNIGSTNTILIFINIIIAMLMFLFKDKFYNTKTTLQELLTALSKAI
jgi:hypothetical protein